MPFVCEKTGEVVAKFEESTIEVETSPKTLCSTTVAKALSAETQAIERWHWKDDHELTPGERLRWRAALSEA